jgi:hypothetical protein
LRLNLLTGTLHIGRFDGVRVLRDARGNKTAVLVVGVGFALALVARDLTLPLLAVSLLGLFDRFVGEPFIRSRIS